MGGLAGHMMHPHDNLEMKVREFKDLVRKTLRGELTMTEKIDGFNIHYLNYNGHLRLARNNNDLRNGGFSRTDIITRFDSSRVVDIFTLAYDLIEAEGSWKNLPNFKDCPVTINAEVVREGVTNIMWYSESKIYKHSIYYWQVNEVGGYELKHIDTFPANGVQYTPISEKIVDDLIDGLAHQLFYQYGLNDENTILDHYKVIFAQVMEFYYKDYVVLDPKILGVIFNRFFGQDKTNLREIRKMAKLDIQPILDDEKFIMGSTKSFMDITVLGLGSKLLNRVEGINAQAGYQYNAAAEMEYNINNALARVSEDKKGAFERRWNACNRKIYGIEGVVVKYNGQLYKWTGPFAPINQLIGGNH